MGDRPLRLHVAQLPQAGATVALSDAALRHARVVRLSRGDPVELFDGAGTVARAHASAVGRDRLLCEVEAIHVTDPPRRRLHLLLGLTKGEKPDLVVRMATELGVASIHLLACARSVAQVRVQDRRVARLQVIAREACAQSGQPFVPHIAAAVPLVQGLGALLQGSAEPGSTRLLLHPPAAQAMPSFSPSVCDVWALVGPEGGLSGEEVSWLRSRGFMAISVGPAILRAETAAIVAAACLMERLQRPDES